MSELAQLGDLPNRVPTLDERENGTIASAIPPSPSVQHKPAKFRRNLGLDLLRTLAVTLVLGRHMRMTSDSNTLMRIWNQGGWIGVDLFFVLSGFLISSLLFNEQKKNGFVDVKRFLIRRGFKIYPAFWVFIVASILMTIHQTGEMVSARNLLGELLFLQNYIGAIWHHTWSLAVEEHFYIGIAIVFAAMQVRRPGHHFRFIPRLFLTLAIICLCFRLITTFILQEFNWRANVFATHIRIDSLFYGVLIAYFCHFHNGESKLSWCPSWLLVCVGCLMLSPAFAFKLESVPWVYTIGFIWLYIGSGLLLMAALRLQSSQVWPLTQLGILGACSYSIYLWHMPVNDLAQNWFNRNAADSRYYVYLLTYLAGSFIVGYGMNRLVETPTLKLRDYLCPPKSANSISNATG